MGCCSDNVLWLFEYPTLNGGERSLLATLPTLRAQGFEIAAAGPNEGPLAGALSAAGVPMREINWRGDDGARRPLVDLRAELAALLKSRAPGLLHANSLSMGRLAGPVAADLDIPSIAHLRDIIGLNAAAVADLSRNRRLLAVSAATRDFHIRQGLPAERTHVLHNGVDLERFRPRAAEGRLHRELGLPDEALLIGTIGQIILRKGLDVLAAAAAILADRLPAAHFVIVGSRYSRKEEAITHEQSVRESFVRGGLGGRVHFLGERDDVADLLPELTLLVHPARQEPLGRVLLEAAACGVAIVATDVGGTREIFGDDIGESGEGENVERRSSIIQRPTVPSFDVQCSTFNVRRSSACLIPPGDPEALAAAVLALAIDPARRAALGQAARRRAEAAFNARAAADGLAAHYRLAIDGPDAAVSTDGAKGRSAPLAETSG